MGETKNDTFPHSFTFPFPFTSTFPSKLVTIALENFEYPWEVEISMFLLLCLLTVFQDLFKVKQLFENTMQRPAPRLDS